MILDSGLLFFGPPCISVASTLHTKLMTEDMKKMLPRKHYWTNTFCYLFSPCQSYNKD